MWRFKPFQHKEQNGLEGRCIDVGNLKLHVRNVIAEGGFSFVYLAQDAVNMSKQYALKHIICNDEESLELVIKEVSVMKSLKGHPNVVTLYAHTMLDMGRTKEAFLVMELCEKSLVNFLESRGAGYFEEKQVLSIFRDVCNAVFAMHCQSPPIAHRDLKAENLLLGSDGLWKLCDFGSTSTNHKRFEKPEEMGIEEDNIRKYTTPAYRAPEMWDLFLRELINEKVDIWALGCLLFRISYFKSAFDGESKLQILNGNYRIPELPKYSTSITDLIRDMLQASPNARPDITQVWFRVNEQLPVTLQKSLPDTPPEMQSTGVPEGNLKPANKVSPAPRRSPPPQPSVASTKNVPQPSTASRAGGGGGQIGAFWSSQHAKDPVTEDNGGPKFDEEPTDCVTSRPIRSQESCLSPSPSPHNSGHKKEENARIHNVHRDVQGRLHKPDESCLYRDPDRGTERTKSSKSGNAAIFQDEAFNTFVAEFDTNKLDSGSKSTKAGMSDPGVDRLKDQLKQANLEKAEITSKYEKLVAICRSQRQEIQELKQAVAARTPSPNKDGSRNLASHGVKPFAITPEKEINEGVGWPHQQNIEKNRSPEPKPWQPFAEDPKPPQTFSDNTSKSVRTKSINQHKQIAQTTSDLDKWGFGTENFTAAPAASSYMSRRPGEGKSSQHTGEAKIAESKPSSQPAGWAGF